VGLGRRGVDAGNVLVSGRDLFGYPPILGGYPDLHNHLFGIGMFNHDAMMQAVAAAQQKRRQTDFPRLAQGYTFKADGRSGYVYYREGERVLEIYWEMSGVPEYDILISLSEIRNWTTPEAVLIPSDKRDQIISGLKEFLVASRIRPDF